MDSELIEKIKNLPDSDVVVADDYPNGEYDISGITTGDLKQLAADYEALVERTRWIPIENTNDLPGTPDFYLFSPRDSEDAHGEMEWRFFEPLDLDWWASAYSAWQPIRAYQQAEVKNRKAT